MTSLVHDLTPHFPAFAQHGSTKDLEESPLYQELKAQIEVVLQGYEHGDFAPAAAPKTRYRAVSWNIERGSHFDAIVDILGRHPQLSGADLYLITEADLGMARSHNRHVARELARALKLNYCFSPSYLNLSKGCGHEAETAGDNTLSIHGNAILSRYPLSNIRTATLPNGKDKMKGREKRIGNQRALIADMVLGDQSVTSVCIHLDAHSSQRHRVNQMNCVLDAVQNIPKSQPILLGGDWNTTTYNSSRAVHAIIGFWIRVAMGTSNMIRNHYPYPDFYWEKELFSRLMEVGFDYKRWNAPGVGTLTYNIKDPNQFENLREWIPKWCFRFIEWSLRENNGICSLKLDWFAGKNLKSSNPQVVDGLYVGGIHVSDHAAIMTDFQLDRSS